jgi:putative membrane protein
MPVMDEAQHRLVSEAVAEAERHTSGEIVTVLADRSDGYTDVALAWCALAAFTVLTLLALYPDPVLGLAETFNDAWNVAWWPGEIFGIAATAGILIFLLMLLIQIPDPVRFALVPGRVKTDRVENRAIDLFKVGADRRTQGRTGVLIYLSMREHRAEIVADQAITEKVAPEVWGEAMADMLAEIRQGRIAEGMVAGVRDVGAILAEHFPRESDDVNELPDRLIEL